MLVNTSKEVFIKFFSHIPVFHLLHSHKASITEVSYYCYRCQLLFQLAFAFQQCKCFQEEFSPQLTAVNHLQDMLKACAGSQAVQNTFGTQMMYAKWLRGGRELNISSQGKNKKLARVAVFRPTFIFSEQHFSACLLKVPFFPPLLSRVHF